MCVYAKSDSENTYFTFVLHLEIEVSHSSTGQEATIQQLKTNANWNRLKTKQLWNTSKQVLQLET